MVPDVILVLPAFTILPMLAQADCSDTVPDDPNSINTTLACLAPFCAHAIAVSVPSDVLVNMTDSQRLTRWDSLVQPDGIVNVAAAAHMATSLLPDVGVKPRDALLLVVPAGRSTTDVFSIPVEELSSFVIVPVAVLGEPTL
jgi:hypothetical protein